MLNNYEYLNIKILHIMLHKWKNNALKKLKGIWLAQIVSNNNFRTPPHTSLKSKLANF